MNEVYLNKVLIYLQQELPENYRQHIKLSGEKLVITIPDTANFSQVYEALYESIVGSINRIRSRDIDLEFTIQSKIQERDFKIWK
jgi:hypothetical protein